MESVTTTYKHKIVFMGNISVGKTSLINRYVHGGFIEEYQPTVGIDFVTKSIPIPEKSLNLQLQLWDTAGQEKYQSVIPIYIKDSTISIVVFDLTETKSFDTVQKWVEEIKSIRGENAEVLLVGNKSDLKDLRKVTKEDADKKIGELKLPKYYEISAKTGDGISTLFEDVVKILSDKLPEKVAEDAEKINPYNDHTPHEGTTKNGKCGC